MSAVPQQDLTPQPAPPAPAGVVFIPLKTAGERAGVDPNGLRHRLQEWVPRNLAKLEKPADGAGGKAIWWVREDADVRFMRGGLSTIEAANAAFAAELRKFTTAQQNEVLRRERIVLNWQKLLGATPRRQWDQATQSYLDELLCDGGDVSRSTLYNWNRRHEAHGRAGLIDARWRQSKSSGDGGAGAGSPFASFYEEVERFYLDGNQPSSIICYRQARALARRNGWPIPSERSVRRFVERLSEGKKVRHRKGPKAFDDHCAAHLTRDYTKIKIDGVEKPMESDDIWCADHHICDVMVTCGRHPDGRPRLIRPWLTAWQDIRSRRIIGYRFSPIEPDSSSVLLALRDGIIRAGMCVPRYAYTDNGKDFDCYQLTGITKAERRKPARVRIEHDTERFAGAFARLRIGVMHAIPYNAKAKPVERWFRTFEEQFGKLQRTYCGGRPQDKPFHLAERLKNGEAPEFDDFVADASDYIEKVYHNAPHTGHGMEGKSPAEVYAQCRGEQRTLATTEDLDCCMTLTPKPVKAGKNGVVWKDRVYGRGEPALRPWFGKLVQICVDPQDVTKVQVRDTSGAFICDAAANGLSIFGQGVSSDEDRELRRRTNAHNKAYAQVQKFGMRPVRDPLELLIDDALATAPTTPTAGKPTSVKTIQTGLERSSELPQSIPLRPAVGSESVPVPAAVQAAPTRRGSVFDKLLRSSAADEAERRSSTAARSIDPWAKATKNREAEDV